MVAAFNCYQLFLPPCHPAFIWILTVNCYQLLLSHCGANFIYAMLKLMFKAACSDGH